MHDEEAPLFSAEAQQKYLDLFIANRRVVIEEVLKDPVLTEIVRKRLGDDWLKPDKVDQIHDHVGEEDQCG